MKSRRAALETSLAEHRAAVDSFAAAATAVAPAAWRESSAPGKWAPADVAEHVRLSFEILRRELEGGPGMKVVLPAWKRILARRYLRRILATGRFPPGARAPREARPAPTSATQAEAVEEIRSVAQAFASACASVPDPRRRRLTHAYFGALPLEDACRLLVVHTRHHEKQLPRSPVPGPMSGVSSKEAG